MVDVSDTEYRWSQPAERNQGPILDHLKVLLPAPYTWRVLEIGSGTGQHAVHFTNALPNLQWQTSDLKENLATINCYLEAVGNNRVLRPLELNAETLGSFTHPVDAIYTANTCHIMPAGQVRVMIKNAAKVLPVGGLFIVYGPFHVGGQATSEGNYRFDLTLSQHNPWQGIRNREDVARWADAAGFSLTHCYHMPANNQLLVFSQRRH